MESLTVQQRLHDICSRCGLSEEIVKRVLSAERDSIVESLKHGERATLIGRCVLRPEIRQKLETGGRIQTYVKVTADPIYQIERELAKQVDFEPRSNEEEDDQKLPEGIRVAQIQQLL